MKPSHALMASLYLVAIGLVVAPLAGTFVSVLPVQVGVVSWRFGAAGMFSRGLLTSLMGLVLAGAGALVFGHRRTLRWLAVASGLVSVVLLAAAGLLLLDAVELRGSVRPQSLRAYEVAAAGALVKTLHAWLVTTLLAVGGWKTSRLRKTSAGPVGEAAVAFAPRRGRIVAAPTESSPTPSGTPLTVSAGSGELPP